MSKHEEQSSGNSSMNGTNDSERLKLDKAKAEDYGYYFYPDREGAKPKSAWQTVMKGRASSNTFKCEMMVTWCLQNNPMVKLLSRALKSHGCDINLGRHISCEDCLEKVNGGFDPSVNQVVVCQNNASSKNVCCNVLAHEFVHMFDFCRAKVDFKKLEHLACTEIRAANLMHCSFLAAFASGDASPFNYKQQHATCVKSKAIQSVLMVRNVTQEQAVEVVDKVFDKCYRDLEPVGRRPRKNSRDPDCSLLEGTFYGYV